MLELMFSVFFLISGFLFILLLVLLVLFKLLKKETKKITKALLIALGVSILSIILAIGTTCPHDWNVTDKKEATCTENGYEKKKCNKCGREREEILEALGHNMEVIERKDASEDEEGYMLSKCSRCGYENREIINKIAKVEETTTQEAKEEKPEKTSNENEVKEETTTAETKGKSSKKEKSKAMIASDFTNIFLLPSDCDGNNIMLKNDQFEVYDIKFEGKESTDYGYTKYKYSGYIKTVDDYTYPGVMMGFMLFNKRNEGFGNKDDVLPAVIENVAPGQECPFTFEAYVPIKSETNVTQVGLVGLKYIK